MEVHLDYHLGEINQVYWRRCLEALPITHHNIRLVTLSILAWAVDHNSYFGPLAELDWKLLNERLLCYPHLEAIVVSVGKRGVSSWILGVDEMCAELAAKFSPKNRQMLKICFGEPDSLGC